MVFILNTEFGLFTYKMIFIENRQWAPISRDCRVFLLYRLFEGVSTTVVDCNGFFYVGNK